MSVSGLEIVKLVAHLERKEMDLATDGSNQSCLWRGLTFFPICHGAVGKFV